MNATIFSEKLLHWYAKHRRELPWRGIRNPYFIWLSEVILQQTRVVQGTPYYLKFIENFPTVRHLAEADEKEVLRLWQGLGYYSRARNLHTTAKMVVEQYGGEFPKTYAELLTLKGIGTYTAAAIASFAFGERVAVLDGNVYRVLARVFGEETDIASNQAKKVFGSLAQSLLPEEQSDTHNQAMMEFGALQCTPASPNCMFCPFALDCVACNTQKQGVLPIKSKKIKVKERYFQYVIIEKEGQLAMRERMGKDVWAGMYDFYLVENDHFAEIDTWDTDEFLAKILQEGIIVSTSNVYTHILTHQRIYTQFWHIQLPTHYTTPLPDPLHWYDPEEIEALPKSVLVNNFLKDFF